MATKRYLASLKPQHVLIDLDHEATCYKTVRDLDTNGIRSCGRPTRQSMSESGLAAIPLCPDHMHPDARRWSEPTTEAPMATIEQIEANRDGEASALAQQIQEARAAYEAWEARRLALRPVAVFGPAERAQYRFLCRQAREWWERAEELDMQADAERAAAQRLAVADYALTLAPVAEKRRAVLLDRYEVYEARMVTPAEFERLNEEAEIHGGGEFSWIYSDGPLGEYYCPQPSSAVVSDDDYPF